MVFPTNRFSRRICWCFWAWQAAEIDLPPRVVPDAPDAAAASKAMELYDTNHDGFLDAKELEQVPGLKAAMKQVDTNHDGKITEQEIADRIKFWSDLRMGRMSVNCRVMHNGKPLAGAKVVFAPEKFLGDNCNRARERLPPWVLPRSTPYARDPTVHGLSPGFYRVEITKEGENIPAKYNTATTLGAEITAGWEANDNPLNFDLMY